MTAQENPEGACSQEWLVQSLRCTAFPAPSASEPSETWWSELIGEEPEVRIDRPKSGERREEGPFGKGRLSLIQGLGRIDWRLSPKPLSGPEEDVPTAVGRMPDVLEAFSEVISKWLALSTCPRMQRLAFGAVLILPVEDRASGYRILDSLLPAVELDPESSSDFSYQINRCRHSNVCDVEVNRLSKWSVVAWMYTALQPDSDEGARVMASSRPQHACRLEVDVNTVSAFEGQFTVEKARELWDELKALATEIATEGDKP